MIVNAGTGPCWTPRTRYRANGTVALRNVWHDTLMAAYSDAAWSWEQARAAASHGYATEEADYALEHPRPQLRDMMVRLGRDWRWQQAEAA